MKKLILLALLIAAPAFATKPPPPPKPTPTPTTQEQDQDQSQAQDQDQSQNQDQAQDQNQNQSLENSTITEATGGDARNEGNSLSVTSNYESGPADIVLIPQGHTAGCMRTYGLSFGNKEGGGGLGIPFRDTDCDFDNEAADAFASGQYKQGWFWNCQKKSSYKPFYRKVKGVDKADLRDAAVERCMDKMAELYFIPEHVILERKVDALKFDKDRLTEARKFDKEHCQTEVMRATNACNK